MSSMAVAIAFGPAGSSPWMPERIHTAGPALGERNARIGNGDSVPSGADSATTSAVQPRSTSDRAAP